MTGLRELCWVMERAGRAWRWTVGGGIGVCGVAALVLSGCGGASEETVVVYTSQDQVYAEPVLRQFTRQTGIRVQALYDSEAVKTVGLANRLLAEARHPQCDVFWNNEELRTRQLAARGLFGPSNRWVGTGFRSRRLVVNTNLVSVSAAPVTLLELTNAVWHGKVALAYPLFGTTATHFLALRQQWGTKGWADWCRALQANRPFLVEGNSLVVRMVGAGEAWVGLTDSDDIAAGQRSGWPLRALPLTAEMLLIANTIALIPYGPHPQSAERLVEYLQGAEVVRELMAVNALEGDSPATVAVRTLEVDWTVLLQDLDIATEQLQTIFLR